MWPSKKLGRKFLGINSKDSERVCGFYEIIPKDFTGLGGGIYISFSNIRSSGCHERYILEAVYFENDAYFFYSLDRIEKVMKRHL